MKKSKITGYHIGNSLTWDGRPYKIKEIANQNGYNSKIGYHIACSKTMSYIFSNPDYICLGPSPNFGSWNQALIENNFNYVTLQPYSEGSTLKSEEDAIVNLIDYYNGDMLKNSTIFYIYAAWSPQKNFNSTWNIDYENKDDNPTVLCRQYFNFLLKRVRDRVDTEVYLIPVGEAFYNLGAKLETEGLGNIHTLFRDDIHASLLGGSVAALTTYYAVYGQSFNIRNFNAYFEQGEQIPTEKVYQMAESIIKQVVKKSYRNR